MTELRRRNLRKDSSPAGGASGLTDSLGVGPRLVSDPIPLNNFTSSRQILFGIKHASISNDCFRRTNIVLGTCHKNPCETQLRCSVQRLLQYRSTKSPPTRARSNSVADMSTLATQSVRERMTNIRDANYSSVIGDEPIRRVGNKPLRQGDSAGAVVEAAEKCVKIVMFELEDERNKRFARCNDFTDQAAVGFAQGSGRRHEFKCVH